MPVPVLSRRDLDFLLYDWLDVVSLTDRPYFAEHSRETFDGILDLSADLAAKHFATHNKKSDATEPRIGEDGRVEIIPEVKELSLRRRFPSFFEVPPLSWNLVARFDLPLPFGPGLG